MKTRQGKHIIIHPEIHAQLKSLKPDGATFNHLMQYLMIKSGLLPKNHKSLVISSDYMESKMEGKKIK